LPPRPRPTRPDVPNPSHGAILPRVISAVLLRREFYAAVAADPRATGPAGAIVCLTALGRESPMIYEFAQAHSLWAVGALGIVVFALGGWLVYGALSYRLARLLAPGAVEFKTVLRCMGYAETVTLLRLLARLVDPLLYGPLHVMLLVWSLLAVRTAMRAASGAEGARLWLLAVACFVIQQAVLEAEGMLAY
jgi:hypothetical protein